MSLDAALPTLVDLQALDINKFLTRAQHRECVHYASELLSPLDLPKQPVPEWKARTLVGFVASLQLRADKDSAPFGLGTWFGELGPANLSKEQLAVLAAWMPEVSDPELRARVSDLLWTHERPRRFENAKEAIAAYAASAMVLARDPSQHWPASLDRFQRAIILARKSGTEHEIGARIEELLRSGEALQYGPRDARLMLLMLNCKLGSAQEFEQLAEKSALAREKAAATTPWGTSLDHEFAREYWTAAAFAALKMYGANSAQARNYALRAAETHILEAEKALEAAQPGVAAHFFSNAVTALRRAGAPKTRVDDAIVRLRKAQNETPQQSILTEIDVTEQVNKGRATLANLPLKEALRRLARIVAVPKKATLRAIAERELQQSVVGRLVPAALTSTDNRVLAHLPTLSDDEKDADANERVIKWRMWSIARRTRTSAVAYIQGGLDQLLEEHHPRLHDLSELMATSWLVPSGHERLLAKGLLAGLHGEFDVACHLLVPQLENALRHFVQEHLDIPLIRHDEDGTQMLGLLNRILNQPELENALGEDVIFDLQGLLVRQESDNLRNELSHGLIGDYDLGLNGIYLWWMSLRLCTMLAPLEAPPSA